MKTATPEALKLFMDGAIALARVEQAGIRIDVNYLDQAIEKIGRKISRFQERLKEDEIYKVWRREYGDKTNLGSREQLGHVLFDVMKHPYTLERTKTGRYKTDAATFESIDIPFVKRHAVIEKLKKAKSTYLEGIRREVVDGFIHPFTNLHTVVTYRSSMNSPNFQNFPIRDPGIGKIVRRCVIPREGRVLIEADFGALEFCIAACFWNDPAMISYASDPAKDIHRDTAGKCYKCSPKLVSKEMRFYAKNQFVFPILYGSDYIQCSRNLWDAIDKAGLKTTEGEPVKELLARKGIESRGRCNRNERPLPGTFENHIYGVEAEFNREFSTFARKKEEWIARYKEECGFSMMTGFRVDGIYGKNFLLNAPIQGPGFHCLLWCLNESQKWIDLKAKKTLIIAEIHDCLFLDTPLDEVQSVLNTVKRIMTVELPKAWKWIVVPMKVEVDVVPAGKTWFDKEKWDCIDGVWGPVK